MSNYRKPLAVVAVAALASVSLAACGSGSGGSSGSGGNTLHYLTYHPAEHLDPQRVYIGRDISNLARLAYRSWVAYPVTTDPKQAFKPAPDLATDTGTKTQGGKVWQFTLKDGVKWQDGKPIKCEDFKYGLSRSFATDQITGGPNYILSYLDIPTDKDGTPAYKGPYKKTGQADFDKAVTCDNKTITYRFNKPWPDFNLAVASLAAFDPYRKDQDKGAKSNFTVFSDGPYKLQGSWDQTRGGTFVKNPQWSAKTDDIRKQNVDSVVFEQNIEDSAIQDRMQSGQGDDANAVTDRPIPSAAYSQIVGDVAKRATLNPSPFVDYLVTNFKRLTNQKVRQALMLSTDQQAWINAGGGKKAFAPAKSIVDPDLIGAQPNPAFKDMGNVQKAKQVLKSAGVKTPYPIIFAYEKTERADKQAAALQQTWQQAGFKVTLKALSGDSYYSAIQNPDYKADLIWGGWGADWPTIATVLPPLFDSRPNLSKTSNGQDYGNYKSAEFNKMVDQAAHQSDVNKAAQIYAKADQLLGQQVAYIPLEIQQWYYLHGANVSPYTQNPATSMYPDLGDIGIKK